MIKGIEKIKTYLGDYPGSYVIIGGTACSILMDEAGLKFRSTSDVDMILLAGECPPEFLRQLQAMIRDGGYARGWKKDGEVYYFRFDKPTNPAFPEMVEFFSGDINGMEELTDRKYLRLSPDDDFSPISAILLNGDYHALARQGLRQAEGVSILMEDYLVLLKIKAFLNLSAKKANGLHVNSDDILKHKRDVFRLCQLLVPGHPVAVPPEVLNDISAFLRSLANDQEPHRIAGLGIDMSLAEIVELLRDKYVAQP